ncbi:MAG: hypothetical protein ACC646_13355, partial [Paracoccaceae bacterium]
MKIVNACRACGKHALDQLFAFGDTPIADNLRRPGDTTPQFSAPLTLMHCTACGLCQIRETVEPRLLFGPDYPYFSSVSPALMAHFHASAQDIIATRNLAPADLVIEAAS